MVEFKFSDEFTFAAELDRVGPAILYELLGAITLADEELAQYIQFQKLEGQVLNRVTGNLQRSIVGEPALDTGDEIVGVVTQEENLADYGNIHEFGGTVPERFGRTGPMHWISDSGESVFSWKAKSFTMPERSFMRTALDEMGPRIEEIINHAIETGLEG